MPVISKLMLTLPCCWAGMRIESLQMQFSELDEGFLDSSHQIEENAFWKQTKTLETLPSTDVNVSAISSGAGLGALSYLHFESLKNFWRNQLPEWQDHEFAHCERPESRNRATKLKPHPSISQFHLRAGKRENGWSVILYSRSASPTPPLLCMTITHYTTKSTWSVILLLLSYQWGWEALGIWSTCENYSDTTANCFVF